MALDDFISFILLFYFKTGKKLSEGELNSLIAHAHRRIEQLQHQLANHMAMEKERIQEALNIQQKADETVCDRRIQDEALKIKNSINLEKSKWVWMRKQTTKVFLHLLYLLQRLFDGITYKNAICCMWRFFPLVS